MRKECNRGIATIAVILGITVICITVGLISDKFLGPDNAVEQEMEEIIKDESGVSIDLSPENA